ncbi:MICAL-like protein 1 isoform X2 [Ambystoma mexicanum]|uniref:MICAL-like protein 1 isoform X2 n=1 Tax=Ambystoma mexicanum TaxID=8296 RepID=UPI0037E97BEA
MSAVRAMQEWCRLQCEGYQGVQIRDLSTSFRDGLAFCALIHRHRPDLLDFDSLSKENVYENNRLAFEVAEQELGIPALLDPTDMVSMKVPDRLSIMTYLSQYYNYFRNPPPGVPHAPAMKRSAAASSSEPSLKKIVEKASTQLSEEEPSLRTSLSSTCTSCCRHVHLVQRYLVEGRLYHRQCFRCRECCGTLLPGSYMPGPESGTFVCTHHSGRGSAISQSAPFSRQDESQSGGKTITREEAGVEEGSIAIARKASGMLPMHVTANENSGSALEPLVTNQSDRKETACPVVPELTSDLRGEVKGQCGKELGLKPEALTDVNLEVKHSNQAPVEPKDPAKHRPQIQPKPALPIKPLILQNTLSGSDSGVPCTPINIQDHIEIPMSSDPGQSFSNTSLPNPACTSNGGNELVGPNVLDNHEEQTAATSPSCDSSENPASIIPQDPVDLSPGYCDLQQTKRLDAPSKAGERDSRPVPAARRPVGVAVSPQMIPVPRPRSTLPVEPGSEPVPPAATHATNGVQLQSSPPVPKPRVRPKSSERVENCKPHKEPPWIALVQTDKRRKAAPPPPGTPPGPHAEEHESPAQSREGRPSIRKPPIKPKPYNPFEDEDEEEEAGESSYAPGHPWYGITPTSSPKSKKRAAPKAPNASPLAQHSSLLSTSRASHSEPSSSTPSPAISIESLSLDPSMNETVSKSSSEPAVHAAAHDQSNGSTKTASLSACELANHGLALATSPQSSRSSSCGSLRSSPHRPPPPKPPAPPASSPAVMVESEGDPAPPLKTLPKSSCKENPFNRKSSPTASPVISSSSRKSMKGPKPARPPAPGHGFPLVKRKVQADQYIPEEDIQGELNAIERQLDEMELRGIELEGKLRSLDSETEDDDELLVDWFRLIHEKHMLVRRESELVYVIKQQNLEQRQADVEYELRCLLNKPEKDWTDDDRAREQVLMQELVTIIEQRNAIVTCLDEDRQREEEEDKLLAAMIKNKDFQRDPESLAIKKKGKFKPLKALKLLGSKPDPKSKSPKDKS